MNSITICEIARQYTTNGETSENNLLAILEVSASESKDKVHNLRCQFQNMNKTHKFNETDQPEKDNFMIKWMFFDDLKLIVAKNRVVKKERL